jgi:RimJ/RimL family protein N-acetyltransferase
MQIIMADHLDSILVTDRLFIRRFALSDAPFILNLLNQKSFIENIRDVGARSIFDAENYLKTGPLKSYEKFGFGLSMVVLKSGESIGMCGLIKRDTLPDVDIGFAFLPEFTNKGYAYEASKAVLNEGFEHYKLDKIIAIADQNNRRSIQLLLKLGMNDDGLIRLSPDDIELKLFSKSTDTLGHT